MGIDGEKQETLHSRNLVIHIVILGNNVACDIPNWSPCWYLHTRSRARLCLSSTESAACRPKCLHSCRYVMWDCICFFCNVTPAVILQYKVDRYLIQTYIPHTHTCIKLDLGCPNQANTPAPTFINLWWNNCDKAFSVSQIKVKS